MARTAKSAATEAVTTPTDADVATPTDATVITPIDFTEAPLAPPEAQVRKKTNFDKVIEKVEEIEMMAGYGHAELRDTIRMRCAEIRDILS